MKIHALPMDIEVLISFFNVLQDIKGKASLKYRPGKNTSMILEVDFEDMSEVYHIIDQQQIVVESDPQTGHHALKWGGTVNPKLTLTFDVSKTTKTIVVPLDVDMIPWLQGTTVDDLNTIHKNVNKESNND